MQLWQRALLVGSERKQKSRLMKEKKGKKAKNSSIGTAFLYFSSSFSPGSTSLVCSSITTVC